MSPPIRSLLFRSLLLGAALGLAVGPALADCPKPPQPKLATAAITVESGGRAYPFTVEVARTPTEQSCGLMRRQRLAADEGMLFAYEPAQPAYMWMANTVIPLDMLFVGADGRILHLVERTEPLSLRPVGTDRAVRAVVEVPGGTVARLGIDLGDRVRGGLFPSD